ncbi:hypothetical protein PINS_up001850 [Pythium insidiosum]|nr:hypothetical protein PINS_up001850 [Pythium insidiosum]
MSVEANANGNASASVHGAKRKREERNGGGASEERRPKERRLRLRQEELEEEFAATYHGLTALYKLLEVRHLRSPLFLPRTLSYRLVPPAVRGKIEASSPLAPTSVDEKETKPAVATERRAATRNNNNKQKEKRTPTLPTGAMLHEFKIGMTAETIESFKRQNVRVGLLFALYRGDGRSFAANSFELVATCLAPVPCNKEVRVPAAVVRELVGDIIVATVQVVQTSDLVEQLSAQSSYTFALSSAVGSAAAERKPVLGRDLLQTAHDVSGPREPLFANLLRLSPQRARSGLVNLELSGPSRGVVKLQFRLAWDAAPRRAQMQRLEAIVARKLPAPASLGSSDDEPLEQELAIPKRLKPSPWTRRGRQSVWFHYLYHKLLRRMSEKRPDYSCAWCNMYAGSLRGLVSHLVSSHSRFRFTSRTWGLMAWHRSCVTDEQAGHDNVPHIYVMPKHHATASDAGAAAAAATAIARVHPSLCELQLSDDHDVDRIEHHFMFLSQRRRGVAEKTDERLQEFDELETTEGEPVAAEQLYAPLLQRQYFHSRTGAVVLDHEKDYDSDDDVDEDWITQQSERLLDEFEDVTLEEKEFMKKWNRHVKQFRILADFMVASSCRLFAKLHGKWIIETGLRFNFLLHLFNLWDNSLLNARAIIDCMLIVDHHEVMAELRDKEKDAASTTSAPESKAKAAPPTTSTASKPDAKTAATTATATAKPATETATSATATVNPTTAAASTQPANPVA